MYDNSFEIDPSKKVEAIGEREIPRSENFEESFKEGVPEFGGETFGIAHEDNQFYGEANVDNKEQYDEGVADASHLINYGLDAVAREKGVETVVQGIKNFDASRSENPLKDLYNQLGVNTLEDLKDVHDESIATKAIKEQFRNEFDMPKSQEKSQEGFLKAIEDMKGLISEVEGANPKYEKLRNAARASGMGYFEYAVKDFGVRGLTDLFSVLSKQGEDDQADQDNHGDQNQIDQKTNPDNSNPETDLESGQESTNQLDGVTQSEEAISNQQEGFIDVKSLEERIKQQKPLDPNSSTTL